MCTNTSITCTTLQAKPFKNTKPPIATATAGDAAEKTRAAWLCPKWRLQNGTTYLRQIWVKVAVYLFVEEFRDNRGQY